ncbi:MAG TPA: alpha-amylase family protein [Candidatus Sulfotelmatobacter sp.]|nr:alpha-amylase family protein [Candidatus Sulfotelmatobacter sp.]
MTKPISARTGWPRRQFLQTLGASSLAAFPLYFPILSGRSHAQEQQSTPGNHPPSMIVPPNKTYRMMEWECHTPPEGNFEINVESALTAARDSGAESMMFYSQDHWGYAFYQSDVAVRHPHLKGDFFGEEVKTARKLGMSVVCYYSLQFNNQAVLTHPDWGWVNAEGEQQRFRWLVTCLDTPYRQYVIAMIKELFTRYEIDELFVDIFGIQFQLYNSEGRDPFCYCKHTEIAWNSSHPGDSYRDGFSARKGRDARYKWHQQRTTSQMLDEILSAARAHRPDLTVSLNGGPETFTDDVMKKVSFIYAEPLTSDTGISLGSILMRGWSRPDYQAGVFSQQGYLDTYPGAIPRVKADGLIVQNARVFIVGNAPVIGGIDAQGFSKRWFSVAEETWKDVRAVDHLLGDEIAPLLSIAMLYSEATREEIAGQRLPVHFRQSVTGALEALTYSGRPVESVPEFNLTADYLSQFEILVLPEVEALASQHAQVIRDWVRKGGTIFASGKCGLFDETGRPRSNFPLADVFGADLVSEEKQYAYEPSGKLKEDVSSIYLESTGHDLSSSLAVSTVGLPGPFLRLRRTSGQEVLRYRLPFMVEDLEHYKWFNWGPPPPGAETAGPAAVFNQFGKGQSLYVGVNLFQGMNHKLFWIRNWIPEVIRKLVPKPIAELHSEIFPEFVHGTIFWEKGRRSMLVQLLNAIELATHGEFHGVPSVEIQLDRARVNVKSAVVLWPTEQELPIRNGGSQIQITIPSPSRYTVLRLNMI